MVCGWDQQEIEASAHFDFCILHVKPRIHLSDSARIYDE